LEEDINCGIIAPDFDVFVVFQEFLVPLLKDMHCLSIDADFKPQPRLAYFPMDNGERLNTAAFVFDDESLLVTRCLVEVLNHLESKSVDNCLLLQNIARAVSADGGGVGQDEDGGGGGGDAAVMANGGDHDEAPEEEQKPDEPEEVEVAQLPEESAAESELEGNKKTEGEPEEKDADAEEVADEPEAPVKDKAEPEVAAMSAEDKEAESENENDDDDEVQMGVL